MPVISAAACACDPARTADAAPAPAVEAEARPDAADARAKAAQASKPPNAPPAKELLLKLDEPALKLPADARPAPPAMPAEAAGIVAAISTAINKAVTPYAIIFTLPMNESSPYARSLCNCR